MNRFLTGLLIAALCFAQELLYRGDPVSVEVSSKAFNLFVFPEEVEKVLTSSNFVSVRVKGKEVLVRVAENEKADLYVRTESGRSYLFYLLPASKPPGRLSIIDTRRLLPEEPPPLEKEREHEEVLAQLIRLALGGEPPPGYEVKVKTYAIDTPSLLVVVQEEWNGWEYRVLKAVLVNKTQKTLRVREDMEFFENLLRKEFGRPYALAITKEFIQPDEKAYLVAVVKRQEEGRPRYQSFLENVMKNLMGSTDGERQGKAD